MQGGVQAIGLHGMEVRSQVLSGPGVYDQYVRVEQCFVFMNTIVFVSFFVFFSTYSLNYFSYTPSTGTLYHGPQTLICFCCCLCYFYHFLWSEAGLNGFACLHIPAISTVNCKRNNDVVRKRVVPWDHFFTKGL